MMKQYLKSRLVTCLLCYGMLAVLTSCSEWLDVRSETEAKEDNLYEKANGFKEALTGIYMTLADQDAYGLCLTMTTTEALASLWLCTDYDYNANLYYLRQHDYTNDYAKSDLKVIYNKLFYAITQTNILLKNIEENGGALDGDPVLKTVIRGEAYALRAYCQLDLLRLFGQIPGGKGQRQVRLPYSSMTAIDEIPSYYDYEDYVARLDLDISRALQDLQTADPAMQYSLSQLNYPSQVTLDDSYLYYRRSRLNYWAVLALRARMNLYLGRTSQAHDDALAVIQATVGEGTAVATLNSISDFNEGNYMSPSECLFALSKYNLYSYTNTLFIGNGGTQATRNRDLVLSSDMFTQLFQGTNTSANNRYLRQWNRSVKDAQGTTYAALCKYYRNTIDNGTSQTENLIIPMLRLSEMYLIVMETTTLLAEANQLYTTYMRDRNVLIEQDAFTSLDAVKTEVVNEYRRELIAEGQMFFTYKRLMSPTMPWNDAAMTEADYIIPLPDTEYEK